MSKIKTFLTILVVLVLVGAVGGGYYFFTKYTETKKILENPTEAAKIESNKIIEKVAKLIELPSGEPTIATVLDKEKLKDQAFFMKAENGDKVLIYAEAQTAILYRPSTNKLIAVAPINLGEPKTTEVEATPKPVKATQAPAEEPLP